MAMTLGGITFRDMEIPSEVPFAGAHHLARHDIIGGDRVIDAMGADDAPISWSGFFMGAGASSRARALDAMRESGRQVFLSWGSFARDVVVRRFEPVYQREYQVAYTICVEVIPTTLGPLPTLGDLIAGDFAALSGFDLGGAINAAIGGGLGAVLGAAGTAATGLLANAPLSALQAAVGPVAGIRGAIDDALTVADAALGAFAPEAVGLPLDRALAGFEAEVAASVAVSDLATAGGYAGRLLANLASAGG